MYHISVDARLTIQGNKGPTPPQIQHNRALDNGISGVIGFDHNDLRLLVVISQDKRNLPILPAPTLGVAGSDVEETFRRAAG